MSHNFQECLKSDQGKLCDSCIQSMIVTTMSRSPLAVRIWGFATVFKHDWGFLPEGVEED